MPRAVSTAKLGGRGEPRGDKKDRSQGWASAPQIDHLREKWLMRVLAAPMVWPTATTNLWPSERRPQGRAGTHSSLSRRQAAVPSSTLQNRRRCTHEHSHPRRVVEQRRRAGQSRVEHTLLAVDAVAEVAVGDVTASMLQVAGAPHDDGLFFCKASREQRRAALRCAPAASRRGW